MRINDGDIQIIIRAAAILEKEYKYHYTHRELALKAGTNESKLRVGFKQIYKCTIHEYLTRLRITKVKEMLLATDWPLQAIATSCGYKNPSLLIRNFKKSTGLTPLEWKAANNSIAGNLKR
ncbi:hypothetical protein A4H97_21055 [Niastella yeongjuensis]|uniref:HTH araC/xylS-type domain-containing protein n=1 Tax=Niastella yeongjuensis TaxID=354355 RepID=A0A1V9FCH1_9BACT|nr:helix-turn-helix transcriptional regulator [Niastella yeongjuensis]OQP56069.1 hypothetical protein A4H97_21055 [Niastella yeongjuensis]SEP23987.1 AraC-type DNA-binding protein [Niastella yeongjuensis]